MQRRKKQERALDVLLRPRHRCLQAHPRWQWKTATTITCRLFDQAGCNPSMSPHEAEEDIRVMHLGSHDKFLIRKLDGSVEKYIYVSIKSDENNQWQYPEWSNHPDYCAVVCSPSYETPPFDVYIVRISTGTALKIIDGTSAIRTCGWPAGIRRRSPEVKPSCTWCRTPCIHRVSR